MCLINWTSRTAKLTDGANKCTVMIKQQDQVLWFSFSFAELYHFVYTSKFATYEQTLVNFILWKRFLTDSPKEFVCTAKMTSGLFKTLRIWWVSLQADLFAQFGYSVYWKLKTHITDHILISKLFSLTSRFQSGCSWTAISSTVSLNKRTSVELVDR